MSKIIKLFKSDAYFKRVTSRLESTIRLSMQSKDTLFRSMSHSRGNLLTNTYKEGRVANIVKRIEALNIRNIVIHDDPAAKHATARLGAHAFCLQNHIFLGSTVDTKMGPSLEDAISHELTHAIQVQKGLSVGMTNSLSLIEKEAESHAIYQSQGTGIQYGAEADRIYRLWWLLPLAAATYVMLRPSAANAPTKKDKDNTIPRVSELQVAGEAFALFYIPNAAYNIGGRLGLGFLSKSALAGASTTTSFRAIDDISHKQFSGVDVYIVDAATGAIVGVVVPGGIRFIGRTGTASLDWLATHGMRRSDLAITRIITERAASNPVSRAEVMQLMKSRNISGKMADWWLNRRGYVILWRGQGQPSTQILSPLARENGLAASEAMVTRMRAAGITNEEIATYTAKWYTQPIPKNFTLPQLVDEPLGAVGIPTTRLPGVASNFGKEGIVYIIRVPRNAAIKVPQWGLAVENEWVILNQVPKGSVVGYMPPSKIPALEVNDIGQLILAR